MYHCAESILINNYFYWLYIFFINVCYINYTLLCIIIPFSDCNIYLWTNFRFPYKFSYISATYVRIDAIFMRNYKLIIGRSHHQLVTTFTYVLFNYSSAAALTHNIIIIYIHNTYNKYLLCTCTMIIYYLIRPKEMRRLMGIAPLLAWIIWCQRITKYDYAYI